MVAALKQFFIFFTLFQFLILDLKFCFTFGKTPLMIPNADETTRRNCDVHSFIIGNIRVYFSFNEISLLFIDRIWKEISISLSSG